MTDNAGETVAVEREAVEAAIKKTEYKYFGDYEMSDDQREAVDLLVATAQRYLATLSPAPEIEERARERALVDAVRTALSCLGSPDGYLPDIGCPNTRRLQKAFTAYEEHPKYAR